MMKYSLLDDSLIRARLSTEDESELRALTLPEVLYSLARKEQPHLLSFKALQAYQRQAWYSFLVQLAAMAVARGTDGKIPTSPEGWRDGLLVLSKGNEAAWHSVVSDVHQPAFMQPPIHEDKDSLEDAGFWPIAKHTKKGMRSLDSFEPLLTSKNHSVKRQRVTDPQPDHWIYALCNTQTMSSYVAHHQRIVRVKSGYASRPFVGLSSSLAWSKRLRRDLEVLLSARSNLNRYDTERGYTLLWLFPWSGKKGDHIPLHKCDPYFIEVSRCLRLVHDSTGSLTYRKRTNPGMRVKEPPNLEGVTDDPWTPITDKREALRIDKQGFHYRLLKKIFLGADYERPPALKFRKGEDGLMYIVAEALGRDKRKTKTHGLHRRIVPVPPEVTNRLGRSTLREELAERSHERIKMADKVKSKVLYAALNALLLAGTNQRASDEGDEKEKDMTKSRKKIRARYLKALESSINASFFESLWESAKEEVSDEEARRQWQTLLWKKAKQQFDDAQRHAPDSAVHYWRVRSVAQSVFNHQANRYLKRAEQASS